MPRPEDDDRETRATSARCYECGGDAFADRVCLGCNVIVARRVATAASAYLAMMGPGELGAAGRRVSHELKGAVAQGAEAPHVDFSAEALVLGEALLPFFLPAEPMAAAVAPREPTEALLPCPFCGRSDVRALEVDHLTECDGKAQVVAKVTCRGCGGQGRAVEDEPTVAVARAMDAWNRRAAPARGEAEAASEASLWQAHDRREAAPDHIVGVTEMIAAPSEGGDEPVAWRYRSIAPESHWLLTDHPMANLTDRPNVFEVQPLYAHPSPGPAVDREAGVVAPSGRSHDLKTWPEPFAAVRSGRKPWELRFNDRGYQVGDLLWLKEWSPDTGYTGEAVGRLVTWMLPGGQFGLPEGYVIMSLEPWPAPPPSVGEGVRERVALDWLAKNTACEVSHDYDLDGDGEWRVHRVNGGVNDREWTLIGKGATPLDAILSALRPDAGGA